MELGELAELGARLVDEVERAVVGKREQLELILRDWAGISQDLRQERASRVLTAGLDDDFDARQLEPGFRNQVGRFLWHVLGDPDEVEAGTRVAVDRRVDISGRRAGKARQPGHDLIAALFGQVGRPDLHDERRNVRYQAKAVSIVDEAT